MKEIAQIVVLAFGLAIGALSVWGIAAPDRMMRFVYGAMEKVWGIHLAVILRLALGAALVIAAADSRLPLFFEILGWIAVAAAVGIVLVGRERLRRLVAWFERLPAAMIRGWLVCAVAFGALLVYGIW